MPELPDVEVFRRYLESKAMDQRIRSVEITSERILGNTGTRELIESLEGHSLTATRRHGKHLFTKLDKGGWLALHFGMTGFLSYFQPPEEGPNHIRLLLTFENGAKLAYDCQRKLGEINLISDPEHFIQDQKLGPDAAGEDLTLESFKELFSSSRAMIKSALTKQQRIAGIGNVYADEILFQAGVHPEKKAKELGEGSLEEIYGEMKKVLREAVRAEANLQKMPNNYLLPHRESRAKCPRCGTELKKIKVVGRGTYLCPSCQPSS
ncbi:MAG: Fpg/Nei family DNA glycosylase [Candidatus Bipolaricaulota bacterium]